MSSNAENSSRERDKAFIFAINSFIAQELALQSGDEVSKERFIIYKQAFNKIIDYVQAYKDLLGAIKYEYELCIDTLEKGQSEAAGIRKELERTITYPLTLYNLEKKKDGLQKEADSIKEANSKLATQLKELAEMNEKLKVKRDPFLSKFAFLNLEKPKIADVDINENRIPYIKGLNVEQATDLDYLNGLLQKLDNRIKDLSSAQSNRFTTKMRKQELKTILFDKITSRDEMQVKSDALKQKLHFYEIALKTVKDYYRGESSYNSIQEALHRAILTKHSVHTEDDTENADENNLESEAEFILDYIDRFNDLFENGKYKEAAYFAAASPRNVLRNIETFQRFKTVHNTTLGTNDPLFMYINAVIDSITDSLSKPNEHMSLECIKIILAHEKIDILTRWVAQKRLALSYEAAQFIEHFGDLKPVYEKKCNELALYIYNQVGASFEAAVCMAKLGRVKAMSEWIDSKYCKEQNFAVYLDILKKCPSKEVSSFIVEKFKNNSHSTDLVISILIENSQTSSALKFLKERIDSINDAKIDKIMQKSFENLDKLMNDSQRNESDDNNNQRKDTSEVINDEAPEKESQMLKADEDSHKEESNKVSMPQTVHNNFYNKFNEELFDDENMM